MDHWGFEKPGVELSDGQRVDVSDFVKDYSEEFFTDNGIARLKEWLVANAEISPGVDATARIGSCIPRPSKIMCIGLNYAKHASRKWYGHSKTTHHFFEGDKCHLWAI